MVGAATVAAKGAKKTAKAASDNPGAAVLVVVVGLVVIGSAINKVSAPFKAAGEMIDRAGEIVGQGYNWVGEIAGEGFASIFAAPAPLEWERSYDESKAFLGGLFMGDYEDDIEQRYQDGNPAVPVPTPVPVYGYAAEAGQNIRDFFSGIGNWLNPFGDSDRLLDSSSEDEEEYF